MHPGLLISLIVVLIIVVILVVSIKNTTTFAYSVLPGFYAADTDFCDKADLKGMYFYIGKPKSLFTSEYPCYIVIHAIQGVVVNQSTMATITERWDTLSNWIPHVGPSNRKDYTVMLTDLKDDSIPSRLDMRYDPTSGSIRLIDGEKLYARLYKDNHVSELCQGK